MLIESAPPWRKIETSTFCGPPAAAAAMPSSAAAWRISWLRVKSRQQAMSGGVPVGGGQDQVAQGVLAHRPVRRLLPALHIGRQARAREREQGRARLLRERRVAG